MIMRDRRSGDNLVTRVSAATDERWRDCHDSVPGGTLTTGGRDEDQSGDKTELDQCHSQVSR